MNDKGQFGSSMWGEKMQQPAGIEKKYSLPTKSKKPETKQAETKKEVSSFGVFGKQGFLDKGSLMGRLSGRQDFFTDSNIRMDQNKRKKFAEKLKKLLPQGKSTLNIGDIKVVDQKLRQQEFSAKTTQERFEIKRERVALKKFFDLKK